MLLKFNTTVKLFVNIFFNNKTKNFFTKYLNQGKKLCVFLIRDLDI